MTDPYQVLGVSPQASDEDIRRAHQEIVQKYNTENHPDNPLAHLAEEKTQQANEAFNQIMRDRRGQGHQQNASFSSETGGMSGGSGPSGGNGSQHLDIRRLINSNRITEAEELLNGVPPARRDAEWFFLKGSIQHSRGWLEDAYNNFSRAVEMNPNNAEYRAALSQLQLQRQTGQPMGGYGPQQQQPTMVGCTVCDMCATMWCANICMQCMCGGCG